MNFIETCRRFIAIDSTPSSGNFTIAKFAAELCKDRGFIIETQEEVFNDCPQMNLVARHASERPALELMLQTHLDTPDPGPYGLWTETGHNPFEAHIIDQKIYGLGSADVKLDFLCKLEAMSSFPKNSNWRLPPVLVGTYGEESGMSGALKLVRTNKVSARMALVGEPSNLQLMTAGKGMAQVEIRVPYCEDEVKYRLEHNLRESTATQSRVFHGKSAHSSTPQLGESAIKKMLDYLLQLPENLVVMEIDGGANFNTVPSHAFFEIDPVSAVRDPIAGKLAKVYRATLDLEKQFQNFHDKDFFPSHPTLNIGLVRTYEDHVLLSGSCRLPPVVTNDVYQDWMQQLKSVCASVGADFRIADYKRPYRTSPESMLVRGCLAEVKQLGLNPELITQSSVNESSLWTRVGIDCVSFGAGLRDGNIHTPNEHVFIDDLKKAIDFYRRIIERFCL